MDPAFKIVGGLAGATLIYFVIVIWQNHKKLKLLEGIEKRLIYVEGFLLGGRYGKRR